MPEANANTSTDTSTNDQYDYDDPVCLPEGDHLLDESFEEPILETTSETQVAELTNGKASASAGEVNGKSDELPAWVLEVAPQATTWSGLIMTFIGAMQEIALTLPQMKKAVGMLVGVLMAAPAKAGDIITNVIAFLRESKSFAKLCSVLNVLGAIVAVVDIGLNVFSIIKEMGELSPKAKSYDGAVKTTKGAMKDAQSRSGSGKSDFIMMISDHVSNSKEDFIAEHGSEVVHSALWTYRKALKGAVDCLGAVFKVITNIASAIVSIAADIASIISIFLGPPAGLVLGLVSAGVTLLNWVIQNFDLDDKSVDAFTGWVNSKYVPSLWGANTSSETIFADMYA